jgi:hypothetical protein
LPSRSTIIWYSMGRPNEAERRCSACYTNQIRDWLARANHSGWLTRAIMDRTIARGRPPSRPRAWMIRTTSLPRRAPITPYVRHSHRVVLPASVPAIPTHSIHAAYFLGKQREAKRAKETSTSFNTTTTREAMQLQSPVNWVSQFKLR